MKNIENLKGAYTLIFVYRRKDDFDFCLEGESLFIDNIKSTISEEDILLMFEMARKFSAHCDENIELVGWQLVPFGQGAEGIFEKVVDYEKDS